MDEAQQRAREILDDNGFGDWSIVVMPASEDQQCASFGLDAPTRTITLVPMQPSTS